MFVIICRILYLGGNFMLKKQLVIFALILGILITVFPCCVIADSYFYDGKWNNHTENVKLYFEGKTVDTDVPPLILNNRTLVPVRAFFEKTGAEVKWDSVNYQVTIKASGCTIKLQIDSTTAYVNNKKIVMDIPAKIITDKYGKGRTLVPVRFISEQLGYKVDWDTKTYAVYVSSQPTESIISVSAFKENGNDVIKIKTTSSAKPVISQIANPDRLVLDFYGFSLSFSDGSTDKSGFHYSNIRYANHNEYARVVIDISNDYNYKFNSSTDTFTLILSSLTNKGENIGDVEINTKPVYPSGVYNSLVVIDPGHGGSDPGALGYKDDEIYVRESDINLDISLKVYEILERNGIKVAMTRTTDEYVGLKERAEYANNLDASLFICIHNNSATIPTAHGTMVYYYTSDFDETTKKTYGITSKELASLIHQELLEAGGRYDRKIADGSKFVVLYSTVMPAILTECAFLSNEEEMELLKTEEFRQKLAEGIAKGVIKALEQMNKQ